MIDGLDVEQEIRQALDDIPKRFQDKIANVAFIVEMDSRLAKLGEQPIRTRGLLLGLYQGVPLGKRGPGYSGVLPDKITIFADAIERAASGQANRAREIIRHTVWHEVGHYFGMNEAEVQRWERRRGRRS